MKLRHIVMGGVLLVLGAAGCSVLPEPRPPVSHDLYTLTATVAQAPAGRVPLTLLLPPPRASAGADGRQMAYRERPGRLDFFARSRWAAPPSRLLHALLLERFTREGPYAHVVREAVPVAADHRLEIELLEFVQDFCVTPSRFRLQVRWSLIDLGTHAVRLQQLETFAIPAPADSPQGGATAAAAAANALFERIHARLRQTLASDA